MTLIDEKLAQAVALLDELDLDVWLTFVRETAEGGDPVLPLILGQSLTWQSALLVTRDGERIAIVGKYEDEAVRSTGAWTDVVPYVEGLRDPLNDVLRRIDPDRIAVNWSEDDVKADGLTYGMYRVLCSYLQEVGAHDRLVSAGDLIQRLRCRKTPGEIDRMRRAIALTDRIFAEVAAFATPGRRETEIAEFMRDRAAAHGAGTAWDAAHCPIVTTGPDSMVGHGLPSPDLAVREGHVFHLDFGVCLDEYCSDIQRAWYVPAPGAPTAPDDLRRAFDTVHASITAAADALVPGTPGWRVDAAARSTLTAAGYAEYRHATGHHVGRAAHDGGGVLGPRWERYGRTPEFPVEPGHVVTLELGVEETGKGYLGLEEMVLVTDDGIEWLSTRQDELPTLPI